MGVLDGLRAVADGVLGTFGTDVTLTTHSTLTYTVSTGTPGSTTASSTVPAVVTSWKWHERRPEIRETDMKLILAAADVDARPDVDDTVTLNSKLYRIVDVRDVRATDQSALYICNIRYDG